MIASRLDVPVVPVRIEGLDKVLHSEYAMADAGSGPGRLRRPDASRPARTTRRWPKNRSKSAVREALAKGRRLITQALAQPAVLVSLFG